MCGQCRPAVAGQDWFLEPTGGSPGQARRLRADLARAAALLLAADGVRVAAYPGSSALQLRTRTGRGATVHLLTELLPAAERLTGGAVDPLAGFEGPPS